MKEIINLWLGKSARLPGVLAGGVRYPDKTTFTQTWSSQYPAATLENAWRCVSDAFQVLQLNRFPAGRVRWVYAHAILHGARRNDGICLGLFTTSDPLAFDAAEIERLLAEFQSLSAVTVQ